jgi:hypothetical protein
MISTLSKFLKYARRKRECKNKTTILTLSNAEGVEETVNALGAMERVGATWAYSRKRILVDVAKVAVYALVVEVVDGSKHQLFTNDGSTWNCV